MLMRMNADGMILMTNNEEIRGELEACNMPVGTFYGKARKFENAA